MQTVFKRVADWNAARYEQEYNHQLTLDLLREEYKEWLEANSSVEELDALCDITYVALGAMWKLGLDLEDNMLEQAVDEILAAVEDTDDEPAYLIAGYLDKVSYGKDVRPYFLYQILLAANTQMLGFGFTLEQTRAAMHIVCDSNDSKSVKKTEANVKANLDKGEYYKPPTAGLTKLLEELQCQLLKH